MLNFEPEPTQDNESEDDLSLDLVPFGMESGWKYTNALDPVEFDEIPPGLDRMEPGPVLAGWLSSIDVMCVSGIHRIIVLKAHQRMASHYQAQMYADMIAVADALQADPDEAIPDAGDAAEAAAAEVRVALHLTRRISDMEMGFALGLRERLPKLAEMLAAGLIDIRRAKGIDRATAHLSDAAAQAVLDIVADEVAELTTGEIMARIRKLCVDIDPEDAEDRFEKAVDERRVVAEATDSGTTNLLGLDLPPERVAAATDRINAIAQSLRGDGESRSMDQLRADIYLDLLDGTSYATVGRGVVDIIVDLDTLTRLNDHAGELAGYGPVIADVARRVVNNADDAEWRVTVTDPTTGRPTHTTTTSRRPSTAQRRRIEARDRTCVFPGCRRPARESDIDHIDAVQHGGKTSDGNLAALCRHDHRIKHAYGWLYFMFQDGGYRWTTRLGQSIATTPLPRPPP